MGDKLGCVEKARSVERGTGDTEGLLPLFSWIHNSTYHTFDTLRGLSLFFDTFRNHMELDRLRWKG